MLHNVLHTILHEVIPFQLNKKFLQKIIREEQFLSIFQSEQEVYFAKYPKPVDIVTRHGSPVLIRGWLFA